MELTVGRVLRAHGLTGEVVVEVRTDDPEARFTPGATLLTKSRDEQRRGYVVEAVREHGARLLLRLAGVGDRGAAEALRGSVFVIDSADLPPIVDPDTYYDHQLEGLRVHTISGEEVGTVTEVLHTAAGELLAVRRSGPGEPGEPDELLVPFVAEIVTSVSLDDRIVEIDPPDGLLELGE